MFRQRGGFGAKLVEHVRDEAIANLMINLSESCQSMTAKRWREAGGGPGRLEKTLIQDSVDAAIYYLLHAVDQGVLHLLVRLENGETIDLTEEGNGELAGWFLGDEGWVEMFSVMGKADSPKHE